MAIQALQQADRGAPFVEVKLFKGDLDQTHEALDLGDRFVSLEFIDSDRRPDMVKLTLRNEDLYFFEESNIATGRAILVTWGYAGVTARPRIMVIRRLRGGSSGTRQISRGGAVSARRDFNVFTLEGVGQEMSLSLSGSPRKWGFMRASEIARELAIRMNIPEKFVQVQKTTAMYESMPQGRLSDAQFLFKLAGLEGFQWYINQDGFHFKERQLDADPSHEFSYRTDSRGTIIGIEIDQDVRRGVGRVRACGSDINNKRCVEKEESGSQSADGSKEPVNEKQRLTAEMLTSRDISDGIELRPGVDNAAKLQGSVSAERRRIAEQLLNDFKKNVLPAEADALRASEQVLDFARSISVSFSDAMAFGDNPTYWIGIREEQELLAQSDVNLPITVPTEANIRVLEGLVSKKFAADRTYRRISDAHQAKINQNADVQAGRNALLESLHVSQEAGTTPEKVARRARRDYRKAQQGLVKLNVTIVGDPTVEAGQTCRILGIGKRLSGKYHIREAKHVVGKTYTTVMLLHGNSSPAGVRPVSTKKTKGKGDKSKEAGLILKPVPGGKVKLVSGEDKAEILDVDEIERFDLGVLTTVRDSIKQPDKLINPVFLKRIKEAIHRKELKAQREDKMTVIKPQDATKGDG